MCRRNAGSILFGRGWTIGVRRFRDFWTEPQGFRLFPCRRHGQTMVDRIFRVVTNENATVDLLFCDGLISDVHLFRQDTSVRSLHLKICPVRLKRLKLAARQVR